MSVVTVVLVHGALLTSSVWMPVQSYLQKHNINVVTVDVPGRANDHIKPKDASLMLAAEKVCKVVNMQKGPVIVAGHSQGGAVITEAAGLCGSRINGLVYIAAVVPKNGEKAFDLLSSEDGSNFDQVAALDQSAGIYRINYNGPVKHMFMHDAKDEPAKRAISDMVSEPSRLGDEALQYNQPVFNSIPKFYIKTTQDKIISPATQEKYIAREHFQKIYALNSSHSPFVSQPHKLGKQLDEIAQYIGESVKQE